jgi:hypothetical protein
MIVPAISIPSDDPYVIDDTFSPSWRDTNGKTARSFAINPGLKTLVLFSMGESNRTTVNPTIVVPTNAAVIDNLNVFDGGLYNGSGLVLGTAAAPQLGLSGNLMLRVCDTLVTNGKFDRVILVPLAVGSTTIALWATGAQSRRFPVAMKRLAARGIVPGLTGVTMALEMGLGANDNAQGTLQAAWQASFAIFYAAVRATGFNGRIFQSLETYTIGTTSAAVRAAQAAVVDNVNVFQSGDLDTLGAADRQADNRHFNDTGAPLAATLIYNGLHASGAPF